MGLYAPVNAEYLKAMGAQTIEGGEFEEGLANLVERLTELGENEKIEKTRYFKTGNIRSTGRNFVCRIAAGFRRLRSTLT